MSRDFNCTNVTVVFSEEFVPGNVGSSLMARFYNNKIFIHLSIAQPCINDAFLTMTASQ